jgi:hypothetical protein
MTNNISARIARILVLAIILAPAVVRANLDIPRIPGIGDLGRIPGIENIIAGIPGLGGGEYEETLTSTLVDAVTEVPFLDDYNPTDFQRLRKKPGSAPGTFLLAPGHWETDFESYCLHAGAHGPGGGDGYAYAPLRGPRASVIRNILVNSCAHPEIPQGDIQMLIWGILARTKISDMSAERQRTAAALLTRGEIRDLNGGALGLIPDEAWNTVFAGTNLPPGVRDAIETEARLRSLLSGGSSYSEIEQIAVLAGPAPQESSIREVPGGRWSYHPGGWFVRYDPSGYSWTKMQISVPDSYKIDLDESFRIVALTDAVGNRFEVEYDDTIRPLNFSGTQGASGYAFASLRFTTQALNNPEQQDTSEWTGSGWTLTEIPQAANPQAPSARYTDITSRVQWARSHESQVRSMVGLMPISDLNTVLSSLAVGVGLLTNGVQSEITGKTKENRVPSEESVLFLKGAWQYLICMAMSTYDPMLPPAGNKGVPGSIGKGGGGEGGGGEDGLSPAGDGEMPGFDLSQRLGIGDEQPDPDLMAQASDYADGYVKGYRGGKRSGGRKGFNDAVNNSGGSDPDMPPPRPLVPTYTPDRSVSDEPWWQGYCDGWTDGWWDGYDDGASFWNALDDYANGVLGNP